MSDPAAGKFEMPGGHLEQGESPRQAALREWQEETGLRFPDGDFTGMWTSANGIYQGFVYTIAREADLDIFARQLGSDPDGDVSGTETIAWWNPGDLPGNSAVRPELLADIDDVMAALGCTLDDPAQGDEATCPCGTPVVYDEMNGWQHADGSISHDDGELVSDKMTVVAKAYPDGQSYSSHAFRPTAGWPVICHYCGVGASDPLHDAYRDVAKAGGEPGPKVLSSPDDWPGWQRDLELSRIYADKLREALTSAVDTRQLARDWIAQHPQGQVAKALPQPVTAFLASARTAIEAALRKILPSAWTEGWALGQQSAIASAAQPSAALDVVNWGEWQPGDPEAASQVAGSGLRDLLASQEVQIKSIASSRLEELGDVLAAHLSSPETERPLTGEIPPVYSVDSLADTLEDVLDNPDRAYMVAQTEIARAQSQAAQWLFQQIGVSLVRVSTAGDRRVCPRCLAAEAAGAQPIGTYSVPLHPRCRCATISAMPALTSLPGLPGVAAALMGIGS